MEEAQKKEVKLDATKAENQKISYEKLTEIANQLHNQNHQLINRVRELEIAVNQVRLEYLFAVIKNSEKFPAGFVEMCVNDIVKALAPVEDMENSDSREEK